MKWIKLVVTVTVAAAVGLYLLNRFLPQVSTRIGLTGGGS